MPAKKRTAAQRREFFFVFNQAIKMLFTALNLTEGYPCTCHPRIDTRDFTAESMLLRASFCYPRARAQASGPGGGARGWG